MDKNGREMNEWRKRCHALGGVGEIFLELHTMKFKISQLEQNITASRPPKQPLVKMLIFTSGYLRDLSCKNDPV